MTADGYIVKEKAAINSAAHIVAGRKIRAVLKLYKSVTNKQFRKTGEQELSLV